MSSVPAPPTVPDAEIERMRDELSRLYLLSYRRWMGGDTEGRRLNILHYIDLGCALLERELSLHRNLRETEEGNPHRQTIKDGRDLKANLESNYKQLLDMTAAKEPSVEATTTNIVANRSVQISADARIAQRIIKYRYHALAWAKKLIRLSLATAESYEEEFHRYRSDDEAENSLEVHYGDVD